MIVYFCCLESNEGKGCSSRLVSCLSTLYLFSKIKADLMVHHATTLQPYLDIKCSVSTCFSLHTIFFSSASSFLYGALHKNYSDRSRCLLLRHFGPYLQDVLCFLLSNLGKLVLLFCLLWSRSVSSRRKTFL